MTSSEKAGDTQWSPFVVVAGVDFSPASGYAIRDALRLAADQDESEIHFVHVVDSDRKSIPPTLRLERLDSTLEEVPTKLRAFVAKEGHISEASISAKAVGLHVRVGRPVQELLQLAVDVAADVIVVGNHGKNTLERFLLGSVSERIARKARCPVLVSRPIDYAGVEHSESVELEPPCPACIEKRKQTGGTVWWCDEHAKPRETHFYSSTQVVQWTEHDSEASATGIDM